MKSVIKCLMIIAFVACQVNCQGDNDFAVIEKSENSTESEIEIITEELEKETGDMQRDVDEIRETVTVVLKQNTMEGEPITRIERRQIITNTRRRIVRFEGRIKELRTRLRAIRKNDLAIWFATMRELNSKGRRARLERIRGRIAIFREKIVNFRERGFSFRRQIRELRESLRALRRRPIVN